MTDKALTIALTGLGLIAGAATPALAHHSFAGAFDGSKPVTVHGIMSEIRLENPHSWFFVDMKDPGGNLVRWGFEGSPPTSLIRSGFKPGTIAIGDEVTVKGYHARDPSRNMGAVREIVLADGRSFIVGPNGD